jgi:hypothetical protein
MPGMAGQGGTMGRGGMMDMMGQGGMMGRGGVMGMMAQHMAQHAQHIEGWIAFLRTELKITDAQMPQWNAFADVLRTMARKMQEAMPSMMRQGDTPATLPQRLEQHEKMMAAMVEHLHSIRTALEPLYASFSAEQKKAADSLVSGGMGRM